MTHETERARELHDKATRGLPLTASERTELDAWYARHDREENAQLASIASPDSLTSLKRALDSALDELRRLSLRIQELETQNDGIRQEIQALQQQLKQASPMQTA